MKLVKGQTIPVSGVGPYLAVPIQLIEEETREKVEEAEQPYIFGGYSTMTNPFASPKPTKKVKVEKLFDIYLMVDRKEDLNLLCLEVGFAGKQHRFQITKGKDTFLAYLTETALNQLVDG